MKNCYCGKPVPFEECCQPIIGGEKKAETAEELMRSRFSAYSTKKIDYIVETTLPSKRTDDLYSSIKSWADQTEWKNLEIVETVAGTAGDSEGEVEFTAQYIENKERKLHIERSSFVKEDDNWYYKDGFAPKPKQYKRDTPKIGRNQPCPCGSGKKYKKCCG